MRNSSRVLALFLKAPNIVDVTVVAPGFWTPRIAMHKWLQIVGLTFCTNIMHHLRGLHDDCDALRFNCLLHCQCNLSCQPLLNLKAPAKGLGNTGQFRQSDDVAIGDVTN